MGCAALVLIDFGRALDLSAIDGTTSNRALLTGAAVKRDYKPKSMTNGNPWRYDLDCFFICTCIYALFFFEPIRVDRKKGDRVWKPLLPPKKRWGGGNEAFWIETMEKLMNVDAHPAGWPGLLIELREKMEKLLKKETFQSQLVPDLQAMARGLRDLEKR